MRYQELNERAPYGFEILQKFQSKEEIKDFCENVLAVECSDFLANRGDGWLYRATDDTDYQISVMSPDQNRRPLQTPRYIHDAMVKHMVELGAKAHRGNSFFCFNNPHDTTSFDKMYGEATYVILPKNGFNYSWMSGVYDLTIQFPFQTVNKDADFDFSAVLDDFFSDYPLNNNAGLAMALQEEVEIMINGECWFILESVFEGIIKEYLE